MEKTNLLKKKIIKGTAIFLGVVLVFTLLSKTIYTFLLPQVTVEKVSSGKIETKLLLEGRIGFDELEVKAKKVVVKAPVEGEIVACYVKENQKVKKGDFLIKIKKKVDEEKKALEQQTEIGINLRTFTREKEECQEKYERLEQKLIAKTEKLKSTEKSHEIMSLEQQIKDKKKSVAVNEELYSEGLISESEYSKEKEDLLLLIKQKESLEQREKEAIEREIETIEDDLQSIKNQLASTDEKIELEENKLSALISSSKDTVVTSPITGVVYQIDIAMGASALIQDQLLVVVPEDIPITLSFNVNDKEGDKIKIGEKVNWISNQNSEKAVIMKKSYDAATDKTIVTCEVDKGLVESLITDYRTYKGVDVEVMHSSDEYDLLVSSSALVSEGASTYIYTIEEVQTPFETKYKVHKNLVDVIKRGDYTSAISGVISQGDTIVKTTNKPLWEGAEVNKS